MSDVKKVENYSRFLLENGLIFEINRKVLHPLGLALYVEVRSDNPKWIEVKGLLKTDDEEGYVFDTETFDEGSEKYKKFLEKDGQEKLDKRFNKLGFLVQEKGE